MKDIVDLVEALVRPMLQDDTLPERVCSSGSPDVAEALHILSDAGRFVITRERGTVVYGYWQESVRHGYATRV